MYLYIVKINLTIDIGNTCCKYAVFSGEKILQSGTDIYSLNYIKGIIDQYPLSRKIFSSVINLPEEDADFFTKNDILPIRNCINSPVKSKYKSPESLGEDRWAAVCGGAFMSGNSFPFLVIQVGTAITFDYVDNDGFYLGGAISPGINMRFKALHNLTSKLPLVEVENGFIELGTTTKDSILSGVMSGCLAEIQYRIDKFANQFGKAPIFVGGGDAGHFDIYRENHIFAVPKIVLTGLNYLLNLNS